MAGILLLAGLLLWKLPLWIGLQYVGHTWKAWVIGVILGGLAALLAGFALLLSVTSRRTGPVLPLLVCGSSVVFAVYIVSQIISAGRATMEGGTEIARIIVSEGLDAAISDFRGDLSAKRWQLLHVSQWELGDGDRPGLEINLLNRTWLDVRQARGAFYVLDPDQPQPLAGPMRFDVPAVSADKTVTVTLDPTRLPAPALRALREDPEGVKVRYEAWAICYENDEIESYRPDPQADANDPNRPAGGLPSSIATVVDMVRGDLADKRWDLVRIERAELVPDPQPHLAVTVFNRTWLDFNAATGAVHITGLELGNDTIDAPIYVPLRADESCRLDIPLTAEQAKAFRSAGGRLRDHLRYEAHAISYTNGKTESYRPE